MVVYCLVIGSLANDMSTAWIMVVHDFELICKLAVSQV